MNKRPFWLLLWMVFESSFANPEQEAKALADSLSSPSLDQQKMLEELRQSNDKKTENEVSGLQSLFEQEGDIGRKGEDPLKASLGKKKVEALQQEDPSLPSLRDTEGLLKQKHRFKFSYTDPLFKKRQEILKAGLEGQESLIKIEPSSSVKASQESLITCRQSIKPELKSCIKRLILTPIPQPPITKTVTTYIRVTHWIDGGGCNCEYGCRCGPRSWEEWVPRQVQVSEPQPPLLKERWEGCEELERWVEAGSCERVESEEQQVRETRSIPQYPFPVTRPHWSERHNFICGQAKEVDECSVLLKQGCEQVGSKCVSFKDGVCVEFENTFKCGTSNYLKGEALALDLSTHQLIKTQDTPSPSFEAQHFGEAITQFKVLTELGEKGEEGLGGIGGSRDNPSVFNGKCSQCRINLGSFFRNCCKLKGILQGFLGGCNEEEKKLAVAAIKKKRCVRIEGQYCHRKVLGVCLEKRESYCCYGSSLARIIQEIAHQQLGISWGGAEHPNCASLTASQLGQLNLDTPYAQSKLAELVPEVQASIDQKYDQVNQQIASKHLSERLANLKTENAFSDKGLEDPASFLSSLMIQIQMGQFEPFKTLITAESGKIKAEDLQRLLHQASKQMSPRTPEFITFLLGQGADARLKDEQGISPIESAILHENREALRCYQAKGLLTDAHKETARRHHKTAVLEGL